MRVVLISECESSASMVLNEKQPESEMRIIRVHNSLAQQLHNVNK